MKNAVSVAGVFVLVLACSASALAEAPATPHAGFFTRVRWAFLGVPEETIVRDLDASPANAVSDCQAQLANTTAGYVAAQQTIRQLNEDAQLFDRQYADCRRALTDATAEMLSERSLRQVCEAQRKTTVEPVEASCPPTGVNMPSTCVPDLAACRSDLTSCMSAYAGALQKVNETSQNIAKYDQYLEQARGQLASCKACASSHGVTC